MALERAYNPNTRWYLAFREAFADWTAPKLTELNNTSNGLIFNLTCAMNQDGSTFDLGDSDTDDSLTFCQVAGAANRTTENPEIVYEVERSKDPTTMNTANRAFELLAWRGVEYFAIMSVGKRPDAPFAAGDRIKMASVSTDYPVDVFGTGENIRLSQTFANKGDVNWNYRLLAA